MSKIVNSKFLVKRLLGTQQAGAIVRRHRWYNEQDRWIELIAALLVSKLQLKSAVLRPMLQQMKALDLLSIPEWSSTPEDFEAAQDTEVASQTLTVLNDFGLEKSDAVAATKLIHEAAHRVGAEYKGKVQLVLREAGEDMLHTLRRTLSLETLSDDELREALTLWLQNVLNLPLPLNRPSFQRYCRSNGLTSARLTEGADELDLSHPALDDLVEDWDQRQRKSSDTKKPEHQ